MKVVALCDKQVYAAELREFLPVLSGELAGMEINPVVFRPGMPVPPEYEFVVFIIDPQYAASQPWLEAVAALKQRSSALLFLVNEKEALTSSECAELRDELEASLRPILGHARIGFFSTYAATLAVAAEHGRPLQAASNSAAGHHELMKLSRLASADGTLTARVLRKFSEIDALLERLRSFQQRQQILARCPGLPLDRQICVLTSRRATGKTLLKQVLAERYTDWVFVEHPLPQGNGSADPLISNADVVLIVSDIDWRTDLADTAAWLPEVPGWFVLNQSDRFSQHGQTVAGVVNECRQAASRRGVPVDRILAVSAYYAWVSLRHQRGELSDEQLSEDREVVAADTWGLPLPRGQSYRSVGAWVASHHGMDQLDAVFWRDVHA